VQCQAIFDVASQGYTGWPAILIGCLVGTAGLAVALIAKKSASGFQRWGVAILAALFVVIAGGLIALRFAQVRYFLRTGRYQVVEGFVQDFQPLAVGVHGRESFRVDGRLFQYNEFDLSPGYHQTARAGGFIREGDYVRIAYSGDAILRVEVCQPK
jgi:hypothetical protein